MSRFFQTAAWKPPIDFSAVEEAWRSEGFSFGVFRDPPGQQWNDFTHGSDEYLLVAEGNLRIDVGDATATCGPGDLVRIPHGVPHSLHTLSQGGSVWLYGYGYWG